MNILIVDDEPMIREWFRMTVDRLGGDYRIAGEAANGREAIEFCRRERVDLVVTDVKMPGMNGLELIRLLKEEQPELRSVIFSSYNEFQFAAEALKFGASEYVLKAEVTLAGLQDILEKIGRDMALAACHKQEVISLRHVLHENEQGLRSVYFRELLQGSRQAAQQFESRMAFFKCKLVERNLTLLSLGIIRLPRQEAAMKIREGELLQTAVINIVNETLEQETGGGCAIHYADDRYLLFVNAASSSMKSQRELLLLAASRIIEHLRRFIGIESAIGISSTSSRLAHVTDQAEEAAEALDGLLFYGESGLAFYQSRDREGENVVGREQPEPLLPAAFKRLVEEGLLGEAAAEFERLTQAVTSGQALTAKQARAAVLEMIYAVIHKARCSKVPAEQVEAIYGETPERVAGAATFYDLQTWATEIIRQLFALIESSLPRYVEPIEKACRYIRREYNREITLQEIAGHVHLSRTYFSELFKKETGVTFNEYLMQARMEKAKEIMQQGPVRVADLAETLGYAGASYFIKLFRKHSGMSPAEYMERLNRPRNR